MRKTVCLFILLSLGLAWPQASRGEPDHANLVRELVQEGRRLSEEDKLEEAAEAFEKAVRQAKKDDGPRSITTAIALTYLTSLYETMGRYKKAEPLYKEELAIFEEVQGKDHVDVAKTLNNLAGFYRTLGRYAEAEEAYLRSLKIKEARLGKEDPSVAITLSNFGQFYAELGQYEKAEAMQLRALKIREADDKGGVMAAQSYHNLALLYHLMGQDEKAKARSLRSLELLEDLPKKDDRNLAVVLVNLGHVEVRLKQERDAEKRFLRALAIAEKLPKGHPGAASPSNALAYLYSKQGQLAKARFHADRAARITEAALGADHPDVLTNWAALAAMCFRDGKVKEAAALFDRVRRGTRRYVATVLPILTPREKAGFFAASQKRVPLDMALSFGLAQKDDRRIAALSAEWLLNAKAADQESLASAHLFSRPKGDLKYDRMVEELREVRQLLARLSLRTVPEGREKQRKAQIEGLTEKEESLSKKVRLENGAVTPPGWTDLASVRKALGSDGVLIDVGRHRVFDPKAKGTEDGWKPTHYLAWVTPPKGDVQVIDLGPADKIDDAVKAFREAIAKGAGKFDDDDEQKAEEALRVHLDALSKLVLAPLLKHVGKAKRWLISPDGNLWLLPFEALTLDAKTYAIEKYRVSYLTSGRDLIPSVVPKVKVTDPVILADPDFDLDPKRAKAELAKMNVAERAEELRSAPGALRLGAVKRLKGTATEAKDVTPLLKAYTDSEPERYLQERALEGVFKSLRNPRVLVLATHGFFLPDLRSDGDEKAKARWENPLLRSGLLLAGCNKPAEDSDDGVLTALEVVGTDLRGCELVVLSACETGVGEVQNGEGVAGLRQAFQLAGAKAVVSTLWPVHDASSARLMKSFFGALRKKSSKADALREAKLAEIERRRKNSKGAHPFFWAAFTLTGE